MIQDTIHSSINSQKNHISQMIKGGPGSRRRKGSAERIDERNDKNPNLVAYEQQKQTNIADKIVPLQERRDEYVQEISNKYPNKILKHPILNKLSKKDK